MLPLKLCYWLQMLCFEYHVAPALSETDVYFGFEVPTAVTRKSTIFGLLEGHWLSPAWHCITEGSSHYHCCRVSDFLMELFSGYGRSYSVAVTWPCASQETLYSYSVKVGAGVGFERSFHIPVETDSPSSARADWRHYGTAYAVLHRHSLCDTAFKLRAPC
jgi:hypothetical protein